MSRARPPLSLGLDRRRRSLPRASTTIKRVSRGGFADAGAEPKRMRAVQRIPRPRRPGRARRAASARLQERRALRSRRALLASVRSMVVEARVRVIYGDTDQMGVVYYANYFRYFELGRSEYLRARGASYRDFERDGWFLPVVEASCSYRSSARFDAKVMKGYFVPARPSTLASARTANRYGFHRSSRACSNLKLGEIENVTEIR